MSLRLYLDDCAFSKRLRDLLRDDGHYVETPFDARLAGARDEEHFVYAQHQNLILLTLNPQDFEPLHLQTPNHPGVFAIYQDNDHRDMSYLEIVRAVQNITDAGIRIAGEFHVLNAWRY